MKRHRSRFHTRGECVGPCLEHTPTVIVRQYKLTGQEYKGRGGPREKGSHLTTLEDFRKTFTSLELNLKRRISYFHSFIRCLFSIYYVLGPVGCWE